MSWLFPLWVGAMGFVLVWLFALAYVNDRRDERVARRVTLHLTRTQARAVLGLLAYASAGGREDVGIESSAEFGSLPTVHSQLWQQMAAAGWADQEGGNDDPHDES